jgi:phosphoribosylformylglycinamidine cyclo-ligase
VPNLTYEQAGVDYGPLDAFKRACQRLAGTTVSALSGQGFSEPTGIRGESAYLVEAADHYLAHVEEGLGTKNLVADEMHRLTGRSFYRNIGIDTVATITNDLVTTGALPISVAMHAGVGDTAWFEDRKRSEDLAEGFAEGCRLSGAVWGGGETPALKGIIAPGAIVLAGSAVGRIFPKSHRIVGDVGDGDAIVLLASSGVHTNGLTLCRALAERLPDGFLTPMDDGRSYGEALCDASIIYVPFVDQCQKAGIPLHYAAHITGHGWRKLMRLDAPFVYRIDDVGLPLPIFEFIVRAGPVDRREAYATFNMGAGFAVYVSPGDVGRCLEVAAKGGFRAWLAGTVRREGSRKAVEIAPLGLTFEGATLAVR